MARETAPDQAYANSLQQRILRLTLAMFGHEINGLAQSELVKTLDSSPSEVMKDLRNLRLAGLAEEIQETKRWRLSPRLPQKALAMAQAMQQAQRKLDETRQRYTRDPV